jgi:hypothetical protein
MTATLLEISPQKLKMKYSVRNVFYLINLNLNYTG